MRVKFSKESIEGLVNIEKTAHESKLVVKPIRNNNIAEEVYKAEKLQAKIDVLSNFGFITSPNKHRVRNRESLQDESIALPIEEYKKTKIIQYVTSFDIESLSDPFDFRFLIPTRETLDNALADINMKNNLNHLYHSIIYSEKVDVFFQQLLPIRFINLFIENQGDADEKNIEVTIRMSKNDYIDLKQFELPGNQMLKMEHRYSKALRSLLIPIVKRKKTSPYLYFDHSMAIEQMFSHLKTTTDEVLNYNSIIDSILRYEKSESEDEVKLRFRINWLKASQAMSFPTYLMVNPKIRKITFELKSDNSPQI